MAQDWNTTSQAMAATTDNVDVAGAALINGVKTSLTHFSGSSDPSTGAPSAWGAAEVGTIWKDTTDADTIVWKQWQRLTAVPAYGWRTLKVPKLLWLTTPATALAAASTAADLAYADLDLSSVLDSSVQDSGRVLPLVRAVCLRRYVKCTGAIPSGDTGFLKLREKGSTNEIKLHAQVSGKPLYDQVWIGLDSGEVLQWGVDTNAGAVTIDYELIIMGAIELL